MSQSTRAADRGLDALGGTAAPAVAGAADNIRFLATHTLPAFVRGFVNARPTVVKIYAAVGQPAWSAATLRALRARHGGAPVLLKGMSGPMLVLLDEPELRRFYAEPVRTLAMDSPDKTAGLSVLEPTGVICSHGELREQRRTINDEAVAATEPVHPCGRDYLAVVADEARRLTARSVLDTPALERALQRVARRIVLGDAAADDRQLTQWLISLRNEGNWMGKRRKQAQAARTLYAQANARIAAYAAEAPAHTLAARALTHPDPDGSLDPIGQTHHWFLALDGLAPVAARTLLLIATHPAEQDAVLAEVSTVGGPLLPRLQACVRESLRLFPLVPDLVRVTRAESTWRGASYPAGTSVLVPALFHNRDPYRVSAPDAFVPGRWLAPGATGILQFAPFSHGGGRCPGENLGLLVTTALCAELLRANRLTGARPALPSSGPLPLLVDTAGIRLGLVPR
ncbi:cytochrome P450 [Streptomyces sp. BR123]|uniref:cytochrome P450 n=1 Tax=Streptomyces sp. BR123 TaxID=2749828 RepID=UPI0015C44E23|nr:cytochrome P450 [Streptomyces sp. BR123]NXY94281.1 cytochrome P450 [Streptomyces sp. BR123]